MASITRGMKVHSSISRLSPSAMENRLNEATNSMVQCSLNTSSDQLVTLNHHADESAFSISKCDSTLGKLISLLLSPERININIVRPKQFARSSGDYQI